MRKLAAALAALIGLALAGPALAQHYSPAALRVIAQAQQASGGNGWYGLRGWRETGTENGVRYERWVDPIRYGYRLETHEAQGRRAQGFNGAGIWEIAPTGQVTGTDDRASLERGRTIAFFAAGGFYFPSRFAANGEHKGTRQSQGRTYEVLEVEPMGGAARELWFDGRTHLLARMVERGAGRTITTELSDYRRAGPVTAPFRYTIDDGDPAHRRVGQVQAITFQAADRALFSLARETATATGTAPAAPGPAQAAALPVPAASAPDSGPRRSFLDRLLRAPAP